MRRDGKPGGVWMLEEATGLLRVLPVRSWVLWLLGTLPFTWFLIDFLLEMSRSAFAAERLAPRSVVLALLYVAKHVMQGLFTWDCLRVLRGEPVALPGRAAVARLTLVQSAWQPLRFPILAAASIIIVPFPWFAAFLRNVGLSAIGRERGFVRHAWLLGRGDTRAHSTALMVLFLCWLLLFLNLLVMWFVVPMLLESIFGFRTEMSRLAVRLLNGTTLVVTALLTSTALEPVNGALAAVRAFYAEARSSGADLRGVLRRLAAAAMVAAVLAGGMAAQERPIDKAALDKQIDNVLHEPEFAWKLPPAEKAADASGATWLRDLFRTLGEWAKFLYDLFKKLFPDEPPGGPAGDLRFKVDAERLRWLMIAAAVLAGGCLFLILRSRRQAPPKVAPPEAVAVAPVNLEDENLTAAELVEDEWLQMADSLASRGEFRLAMRAVHLAGLRYLAEKGLVVLQPAKTGLEYGRELGRRFRETPVVLDGYGRGLREYEGVWYGFAAAGAENYQSLRGKWEELRRYA